MFQQFFLAEHATVTRQRCRRPALHRNTARASAARVRNSTAQARGRVHTRAVPSIFDASARTPGPAGYSGLIRAARACRGAARCQRAQLAKFYASVSRSPTTRFTLAGVNAAAGSTTLVGVASRRNLMPIGFSPSPSWPRTPG